MARAKARARKVTRARIQKPISTNLTSVLTAGNASPTPSRKVVRQLPLLTMETVAPVMEVDDVDDANWRRRNVDWLVLRSCEHVCCCRINKFSPPGQPK